MFPITVNTLVALLKVKLALAPGALESLNITCVLDPAIGPVAPVEPLNPVAPVAPVLPM